MWFYNNYSNKFIIINFELFKLNRLYKLIVTNSEIIEYESKETSSQDEEIDESLITQQVIRELNLLERPDKKFYLKGNVRSKEDILKFLKLIKIYLPNMYNELLRQNPDNLYKTDLSFKETSSFEEIKFTPKKILSHPQPPSSLKTQLFRLFRIRKSRIEPDDRI